MLGASKLIALPTEIVCLILAEWLQLVEVKLVDSAFCNHRQRAILLATVFPMCVLRAEPMPLQATSALMWMRKRRINMEVLVLIANNGIANCNRCRDASFKFIKYVKIKNVRSTELSELLPILASCHNMTSLSIEACKLVNSLGAQTSRCQTMLQSFSIDVKRKVSVEKDIALDVIRASHNELERLELLIHPEFVVRELADVETFPRLLALCISCADIITDEDLIATLRKTPHIRHLNVSMCPRLSDVTGVFIAENLSQLKTLDASWCNFTNVTLFALAKMRANSLQALNISNCNSMDWHGLQDVSQKCVNLHFLHIVMYVIGLTAIINPSLQLFPHVTHLTLDVGEAIGTVYRIPCLFRNAQEICLVSHHVSYREIDFSAYTAQNMPCLRAINFSSYPLPAPGVCPSLDALQVQRPKLKITFDPLHNNFDVMKVPL